MSSLLAGYEYDIFISYRHKDNKGDHWVTSFVNALKTELETTFKEDISIYFDSDPNDGLLESHHVGKSLEGKLKCLIFIPIISQTYCDVNSFAWQHEFLAFNRLAREDSFGREIKLNNGNVASRILPIRINDLDTEDKALLETELGGILRSIDFIYKEPGVNRPLKDDDLDFKNLNGAKYRNQLNKVANAIKEIIMALRHPLPNPETGQSKLSPVSAAEKPRSSRKNLAVIAAGLLVIFAASYFLLRQKKSGDVMVDKSIAVLPFADLSETKDQEWFSDGLTEELLNSMAQLEELKVIARTSSFAFKGKNIPIQKIADSLHVSYIVEGSVRKYESNLRITAQLIQASDGVHIWSQQYDRPATDIFNIQNDIARNITSALDIYLDDAKREKMFTTGTRNVEAYEAFLKGKALYNISHGRSDLDLRECNTYFEKAIQLDPHFGAPYYFHHDLYAHYIMHGASPEISATISHEQAYALMMNDLKNAIQYAHTKGEKLNYEIDRVFLSDNWSSVPKLLSKLTSDENLLREFAMNDGGWTYMLLMGVDRPDIARKLLKYQKQDNPLDLSLPYYESQFLLAQHKPDSVIYLLNANTNQAASTQGALLVEAYLLRETGQYREAFETLRSKVRGDHPALLITRVHLGERDAVLDILKKTKLPEHLDVSYCYLFSAVGQQARADSLAHVLDQKLLGAQLLVDRIFASGGKLPVNLSATPNLSARLREAGVDLKARQVKIFEKTDP